jgi:hypothetical protein
MILELKDGSIYTQTFFCHEIQDRSMPHIDAIRVRIKGFLKVRLYDESSQSRAKEEVNEEKSYLLKSLRIN